jgi:dolichol-phosphate mannosyltransferase
VRAGLRERSNWLQLVRFAAVGASGYVVNLAVFALLVHFARVDYKLAAVGAFAVALANNFVWNRAWTFSHASDGHAGFQAARFCVVSLVAFGFNLLVLFALVEWLGMEKVSAQAIAIAAATPLNFLGNKLWSFRA